jgi:hypothetical protein
MEQLSDLPKGACSLICGLVGIPEAGVVVVECFSSARTTVNVFIELR